MTQVTKFRLLIAKAILNSHPNRGNGSYLCIVYT